MSYNRRYYLNGGDVLAKLEKGIFNKPDREFIDNVEMKTSERMVRNTKRLILIIMELLLQST